MYVYHKYHYVSNQIFTFIKHKQNVIIIHQRKAKRITVINLLILCSLWSTGL